MEKGTTNMKSRQVLTEICEGCTKDYCTLKEILLHAGLSDRQAMQIKIVEKFKYEWSEKAGSDLGWDGAFMKWTDSGMAKYFADIYREDSHLGELYNAMRRWERDKH